MSELNDALNALIAQVRLNGFQSDIDAARSRVEALCGAQAKPVAWMRPDNRVAEESTARVQFSRGANMPPIGTWVPLYTDPPPSAQPEDWKHAYEQMAEQFRAETLRTSAQAELLRRWAQHAETQGCRAHSPVLRCAACDLLRDTETLLASPVNVAQPKREALSEAQVDDGLRLHRLYSERPSQLADAFKAGARWAERAIGGQP